MPNKRDASAVHTDTGYKKKLKIKKNIKTYQYKEIRTRDLHIAQCSIY